MTALPVSDVQLVVEIRAWRERTGKTYYDLADETGVSLATIHRLAMGGPRSVPARWAIGRVRKVVGQ